jgi:hypothetical protein
MLGKETSTILQIIEIPLHVEHVISRMGDEGDFQLVQLDHNKKGDAGKTAIASRSISLDVSRTLDKRGSSRCLESIRGHNWADSIQIANRLELKLLLASLRIRRCQRSLDSYTEGQTEKRARL